MPRLNETLYACIAFANFCAEHKVAPRDLAELIALANVAFKAGERQQAEKADRAYERFEKKAASVGFVTQWDSLSPTLYRKDADRITERFAIRLPVVG